MRRYCVSRFLVYCLISCITETETSIVPLTDVRCIQTFGSKDYIATLRCIYLPSTATIQRSQWSKGSGIVYIYAAGGGGPGPVGEFAGRQVNTTIDTTLGHHEMNIYSSVIKDEDNYRCTIVSANSKDGICSGVKLRVPPSGFQLLYKNGSSFIPVSEEKTDCTKTLEPVDISTFSDKTLTTSLQFNIVSRPSSNITWNQTADESITYIELPDNTTQTTFVGNVTVKAGVDKIVKFTVSSLNPDFTAGPIVKESCIKLRYPSAVTTESPTTMTTASLTTEATTSPATPTAAPTEATSQTSTTASTTAGTTTLTTPTSGTIAETTTAQSPTAGLSPAAIAGICIGCLLGSALIAAGIVLILRKKKLACFKNNSATDGKTPGASNNGKPPGPGNTEYSQEQELGSVNKNNGSPRGTEGKYTRRTSLGSPNNRVHPSDTTDGPTRDTNSVTKM